MNKYKKTKKYKMTWQESNEFMKKVNKIKKQKRNSSFPYIWCTCISKKNETSLDLHHNHFANETKTKFYL
jgi:hypothetical protein